MSKTAQRKQAAWARGAKDGFEGRANSCTDRRVKKDYDSAFQAGRMDRRRMLLSPEDRKREDEEHRERRRELGPEPTQY